MGEGFDPFTIEIVKEKLHAAADEMGVVLARTSMSPIVYEVLDFACGITDADAQVVAQTNGLTLFTGTFGPQIQSILRKHGLEGMREGDVFATNIPYEGGTHTCDVCLVKPIVVPPLGVRPRQAGSDPARWGQTPAGGRVIAFAVSVTHWIEIGGAVPGSISPEATEIYQEGLQLPGVRVVEEGTPSQTLIDLIKANIRLPRTGIGDLNAGLAATAIGEARVREACERYGADLVLATFAHVLDHGEQIARAELRKIPNGTYRASGVIDGDGVSDAEIPIAVAVTVGDDFLHADFGGCAAQTRGPVNCSTGALLSACKTVVRAITAPGARSNDGFFRPFSLTVPPGKYYIAVSAAHHHTFTTNSFTVDSPLALASRREYWRLDVDGELMHGQAAVDGSLCPLWASSLRYFVLWRSLRRCENVSVLLALTPSAQLVVFEPGDKEFKQLARYKVSADQTHAYPVASGNRIFIKDKDSVTLWTVE